MIHNDAIILMLPVEVKGTFVTWQLRVKSKHICRKNNGRTRWGAPEM